MVRGPNPAVVKTAPGNAAFGPVVADIVVVVLAGLGGTVTEATDEGMTGKGVTDVGVTAEWLTATDAAAVELTRDDVTRDQPTATPTITSSTNATMPARIHGVFLAAALELGSTGWLGGIGGDSEALAPSCSWIVTQLAPSHIADWPRWGSCEIGTH
jgi:hypothetical protein